MEKNLYLENDHELTDFEFGFLLGYEICKIDEELEAEKQKLECKDNKK